MHKKTYCVLVVVSRLSSNTLVRSVNASSSRQPTYVGEDGSREKASHIRDVSGSRYTIIPPGNWTCVDENQSPVSQNLQRRRGPQNTDNVNSEGQNNYSEELMASGGGHRIHESQQLEVNKGLVSDVAEGDEVN